MVAVALLLNLIKLSGVENADVQQNVFFFC